jgi:pimeloyl-ACP methyl ester carboxylesterase
MTRYRRAALGFIVSLVLVVVFGPFLVPVREMEGTSPVGDLAGPDSLFVDVDGLRVHYQSAGRGEPVLLLLHGFTASTFSWREVMAPLAELGTVVPFDRPSSGLTARPMPGDWEGRSPYSREAQSDLTVGLMDALKADEAVLIGHSAGGTIAALTALRYPERVRALILVDAAIYEGGGAPSWALPLLRLPQTRRIGPLIARSVRRQGERLLERSWHDPSLITPEMHEGYQASFLVDDWDKALWELTLASRASDLAERLSELVLPTLVITGDDDRIVPTELSIRLADELSQAQLAVLEGCGHVPHEECPQAFLEAVMGFLDELP